MLANCTRGGVVTMGSWGRRSSDFLKIVVHYEVVPEFTDPLNGLYVVKATGGLQDDEGIMPIVESYGECSPKNNRNAYPVAMAEKRALSRVVLKMADLYELGVYGEDELDK